MGDDRRTGGVAVALHRVTKRYERGGSPLVALDRISVELGRGELVVVLGPSGSGKTTALNLIGAIEEPTNGRIEVAGVDVSGLDEAGRGDFRRTKVGFVFQFFNLVPTLTAAENVELVAELTGPDATARSHEALAQVGLGQHLDLYPGQLSGGEQQRVAIARALVKHPPLLLCDEPTGSLDLETGRRVLGLLREATERGTTVVIVTHNSEIARMADRVLRLRDGRLASDERVPDPVVADRLDW